MRRLLALALVLGLIAHASLAYAADTIVFAAASTKDVITDIIKLYEKLPAQKLELAKVKDNLKDGLSRREVQEKLLPDFLEVLKKEANLQYLNGAKPLPEAAGDKSGDNPAEKAPEKPGAKTDRK